MKTTSFFSVALLLASLVVLPGCGLIDWVKDKASCSSCDSHAAKGETVISIGNKPFIGSEQFDQRVAMFFQGRPQAADVIGRMPEAQQLALYDEIANTLVAEQLIIDYAKKNKLDQAPDFKEYAAQMHRQVDLDIALRAFQNELLKELQSQITDEDAKKFYEENRESNQVFQNEPFVTNAAQMKAPAKDGKKAKAEYAAFEAVRDFVKQVMLSTKIMALSQEKLDAMKKERNVVINSDYFKKFIMAQPAAEAQAEAPKAQQSAPVKTV